MRLPPLLSLGGVLLALSSSAAHSIDKQQSDRYIGRDQDNYRTCWYRDSKIKQSDLLEKNFGRDWTYQVDASVYANPLVVPGHGKRPTLLVITTMANSVYAFDISKQGKAKLYWRKNYGMPYREETFISCHDITGDQGILSTPVVDNTNPADPKLFFITKGFLTDDDRSPLRAAYKMWKVDLETGKPEPKWPVVINDLEADNEDWIDPSDTQHLRANRTHARPILNSRLHTQRTGLAILDGQIFAMFAAVCDYDPWWGFIVGVHGKDASIKNVYTVVQYTDVEGGGLWMSGAAPAVLADEHALLITVGNSDDTLFTTPNTVIDNTQPTVPLVGTDIKGLKGNLGQSTAKLRLNPVNGKLYADSFFLPCNALDLDQSDQDSSSSGVLVIPEELFPEAKGLSTPLSGPVIVHGGKNGTIFFHDSGALGGYCQLNTSLPVNTYRNDKVLAQLRAFSYYGQPGVARWRVGHEKKTLVYFGLNSNTRLEFGGLLYVQQLNVEGGNFHLEEPTTGPIPFGYATSSPLITSDGDRADSGIVWLVANYLDRNFYAELRGYGAVPDEFGVLPLLYRYPVGGHTKFSGPTAYGSSVYTVNGDGVVFGFGLANNHGSDRLYKHQKPKQKKPLRGAEYVGCFYETGYNPPARPANALVQNTGTYPPPTAATATTGFVYLYPGLYPFQAYNEFKTIINPVTSAARTTYESCIKGCQGPDGKGLFGPYTFAGIKAGSGCFCSSYFNSTAAQCSMPCPGRPTETCGDTNAYTVFRTNPPPPKYAYKGKVLGCFNVAKSTNITTRDYFIRDLAFNAFNSAFTQSLGNNRFMKHELCVNTCGRIGFQYAGLQNATACWCGNTYGTYGVSADCKLPCPADPSQTCGGVLSNTVLSILGPKK